MLFRHVLVLLTATLALAAPTPSESQDLDDRGLLDGLFSGILGDLFAFNTPGARPPTKFSLFANAQIKQNGKTFNVKGGKWLGLNSFFDIPFAEPPTGANRFKPPVPKTYTGDIDGLLLPKACLQPNLPLDGLLGQSEDCLKLNVLTPDGVAGTDAKLPVLVWVYGGAFVGGAGAMYTLPFLPKRAINNGKPFILVTFNYRVGILGFPMGREMAAAGAGNLGLRDQKAALEWVQANIASFGGDPDKVTVFGESAGAISIALHMLDPDQKLFRGAIMESGAPATLPMGPTATTWQSAYDAVLKKTGCAGKSDSVACLRTVDGRKLIDASTDTTAIGFLLGELLPFPWAPSIDGDVVKDSPYNLIRDGKISNVPFITGNNKDEATLFVPRKMGRGMSLDQFINLAYPAKLPAAALAKIKQFYPDVPALGCPFDTGRNTFWLSSVYKQAAAIVTDGVFHARRRWFLRNANTHGQTRSWTYHFTAPIPILPGNYGVAHATEILSVFGLVSPLLPVGWSARDETLSHNIMDYWVNFAYNLDPNGPGLPGWPAHEFPANKNALQFHPGNITVIQDDFREDRIAVFNDPVIAPQIFA